MLNRKSIGTMKNTIFAALLLVSASLLLSCEKNFNPKDIVGYWTTTQTSVMPSTGAERQVTTLFSFEKNGSGYAESRVVIGDEDTRTHYTISYDFVTQDATYKELGHLTIYYSPDDAGTLIDTEVSYYVKSLSDTELVLLPIPSYKTSPYDVKETVFTKVR